MSAWIVDRETEGEIKPCKAPDAIAECSQTTRAVSLRVKSMPDRTHVLSRGFVLYKERHILSMVLLLPPAPAALVLLGRTFATLSALSAAAFLLIAVAGPPGGLGDEGRAVDEPVDGGELTGEEGRGEDWH